MFRVEKTLPQEYNGESNKSQQECLKQTIENSNVAYKVMLPCPPSRLLTGNFKTSKYIHVENFGLVHKSIKVKNDLYRATRNTPQKVPMSKPGLVASESV